MSKKVIERAISSIFDLLAFFAVIACFCRTMKVSWFPSCTLPGCSRTFRVAKGFQYRSQTKVFILFSFLVCITVVQVRLELD